MPLSSLKEIINENDERNRRSSEAAQRVAEEQNRSYEERLEIGLPALRHLIGFEPYFWQCIDEFAHLTKLQLDNTSQGRTFWGRKKSSLSNQNRSLWANFRGLSEYDGDTITFTLGVELLSGDLEFHGWHGRSGRSIHDGHYISQKDYLNVWRRLAAQEFSIYSAKDWLENGFVEFYKKLY